MPFVSLAELRVRQRIAQMKEASSRIRAAIQASAVRRSIEEQAREDERRAQEHARQVAQRDNTFNEIRELISLQENFEVTPVEGARFGNTIRFTHGMKRIRITVELNGRKRFRCFQRIQRVWTNRSHAEYVSDFPSGLFATQAVAALKYM